MTAITDSQQFKYKVAAAFNLEQAEDLKQHLFAEAQLHRRDNLAHYYRNAFVYNQSLANALIELKKDNEKRALAIFNSQQGNFLKSITYFDKVEIDGAELINYLENLCLLFIDICSLTSLIRELSARVDYFQGKDRQCVDALLICAMYFDGDFDSAFVGIKKIASLEKLATFDRTIFDERLLAEVAFCIYLMEGEALATSIYRASHKHRMTEYPYPLF